MGRPVLHTGCLIEGCFDPHFAKGWCAHHYHKSRLHGTPLAPGKRRSRTCGKMPPGSTCSVAGCKSKYLALGFCRKHYGAFRMHGDPTKTSRGPRGKGHIYSGYHYDTKGVLVHRDIMARSLGRPLLRSETVHHKNGVRSDNRLVQGHELCCPGTCCNLELWSKSQPSGQRVRDKVAWAHEIIRLYGPLIEEHVDAAAE